MNGSFRNQGRSLLDRRWIAGLFAILLLAISLLLAWQSEEQAGVERSRQVNVQARILANSVAGALAFDDRDSAREFLNALQLNDDIQAAAIYGAEGELIEGYVKQGAALPARVQPHPPVIRGLELTVVQPVAQQKLKLGSVYVRAMVEPWTGRASRYFGIGAVIIMAALLIAGLGASYASANAGRRRLQEEIEAREKAESQLRQAQKMEAIGQLTGGVAHDFNNMLMAASSGLELLERTKDPDRRERLKRGIRETLDRGAKLTQQLLTFARRTPLQKEVFDVRKRIGNLTDLLERSLREDISVEYALADDLWPVEVDPSQFDVALLNIAVNARDAMPQGGTIRITARNVPAGPNGHDAIELAIADQGSGMSQAQLDRAFEPFFTTKGVGRGTGLGLSQVYGFAHSAGGTVALSSSEGVGTTVTMLLPASKQLPAVEADKEGAMIEQPGLGWRVMMVEDDDALAELIGQMLTELGCMVTRQPTADDALHGFDRASFDMVLSDMVMPGSRNGLDLARDLRRAWPDLPLLLMTGYSSAANSATEEGFQVLSKPFSMVALAESLSEVRPAGA